MARLRQYQNRLVLILAVLLSIVAWGRLAYVAATNPSPWRSVQIPNDPPYGPQQFTCRGLILTVGDRLYRWQCTEVFQTRYHKAGYSLLVRYDLASGTPEAIWDFSDEVALESHGLHEFVPGAANTADVGFLAADGKSEHYYLLLGNNTRNDLGSVDVSDGKEARGAGLVGIALEVAYVTGDKLQIFHTEGDKQWTGRDVPGYTCAPTDLCRLEYAYMENGKWQFVYTRIPRTATAPFSVELLTQGESGDATSLGQYTLGSTTSDAWLYCKSALTVDPQGILKWHRVDAFFTPFDTARSNVLQGLCYPGYHQDGTTWKALPDVAITAPTSQREQNSDPVWLMTPGHAAQVMTAREFYVSDNTGKHYVDAQAFIGGRWITIKMRTNAAYDDVPLTLGDEKTPDTLALNHARPFTDTSADLVVPNDDGGFWLVGPEGDYARFDSALHRVDGMTLGERFGTMLVDNFRLFGDDPRLFFVSSSVYGGGWTLPKQLSVPVLLLGLPVLLLVAVWQRRRAAASTIHFVDSQQVRNAALIYIVLFAVLITWFCWLTAYF